MNAVNISRVARVCLCELWVCSECDVIFLSYVIFLLLPVATGFVCDFCNICVICVCVHAFVLPGIRISFSWADGW